VAEQLALDTGALLELTLTDQGHLEMRPARIATVGSPEAEREERLARQDIEQGRYTKFGSVAQFKNDLKQRRQKEKEAEERRLMMEALQSLTGKVREIQVELDQMGRVVRQAPVAAAAGAPMEDFDQQEPQMPAQSAAAEEG